MLKQRVRDRIQPERDLGHSDVGGKKGREKMVEAGAEEKEKGMKEEDRVVEGGSKSAGAEGGPEASKADGADCVSCDTK